jgi:hypothetical protein
MYQTKWAFLELSSSAPLLWKAEVSLANHDALRGAQSFCPMQHHLKRTLPSIDIMY